MFPYPFVPGKPKIFRSRVKHIVKTDGFVRFTLFPLGFDGFEPGQFLRIHGWDGVMPSYIGALPEPGQSLPLSDSFLRSPYPMLGRSLSISWSHLDSSEGNSLRGFDLIVRAVGVATDQMKQYEETKELLVIGPLGKRGFQWNGRDRALLVAGGVGIAPLLPLAQALRCSAITTQAFLGARTEREFPPGAREDLESLGVEIHLSTEDGSVGQQGLVTDLLDGALTFGQNAEVCACGPAAMLQALCRLCEEKAISIQVSLESMTACGIGACLGCAILPASKDPNHLLKVCVDGPVFQGKELKWP